MQKFVELSENYFHPRELVCAPQVPVEHGDSLYLLAAMMYAIFTITRTPCYLGGKQEAITMRFHLSKTFVLTLIVTTLGALACDLSTLGLAQASKPLVAITSPTAGAQFREGDEISVQSTATDPNGIVRVELAVDGTSVRTDAPPIAQGQKSFTLLQKWTATAGTHTLSVRAFNASGAASDPALVAVTVTPGVAVAPTAAAPIATLLPPLGAPTNPPLSLPTIPPAEITVANPTPRPPTRVPPTPTISAPPGVWAISIRVDPPAPKRGQGVKFFVTFLNTTSGPSGYRWRIRIFEPDKRNSFGDTAPLDSTIPLGRSEIASMDNWKVTGPGDCIQFFARAFSIDPSSKQETEFIKPDQSGGPAASFQVCP
jgi:hypothetical protein